MKKLYFFLKDRCERSLKKPVIHKILFILTGIAATCWFLVRVIPKPSRANYPCMQAAAPTMSAFVIYLMSIWGGLKAYKSIKAGLAQRKISWVVSGVAVLGVAAILFTTGNVETLYSQVIKSEAKMVEAANNPLGEGKGIFQGRVVWAYAPLTTNCDTPKKWYEDQYTDQSNCDWLIKNTLTSLTNQKSEKQAWSALFRHFNAQRGEKAGYKAGEKLTIKVNQNNSYEHSDSPELNASPHLVLSLLNSLVNEGGVKQEDITVTDPSRFMTNAIFDKCYAAFPNIVYEDNVGGDGRSKSTYVDNAIPYSTNNGKLAKGIARSFVDAKYVINFALLKGHEGQGVTLCGKNWYGATSIYNDWRKNSHDNFNQNRDGSPRYITFVDYMGHKDLGGKTMLYLIDGIFGSKNVAGPPSGKWQMAPFNDSWPSSLFASQDPVAIDAVALDFLATEFPRMADIDYADAYMAEAAEIESPRSETAYDPEQDGTVIKGSLGTFEHWNNPIEKKYSRNMGQNRGIELISVTKK